MTAKIEFNLEDPEDIKAFTRCLKATDMASVLFEISHNLSRRHDSNEANKIMSEIYTIIDQHGIVIDELIS